MRMTLVGPLPPPFGGMANQTAYFYERLRAEGIAVELVQTNPPYRPAWVSGIPWLRAMFRLIPYLKALFAAAGRSDLFHVMANSGWSWHLFAAPAVWIAHGRGCRVILNYRGGEADRFFARSFRWIRPTLARCERIVVPSGFLQAVFASYDVRAEVIPNPIAWERFAAVARDNVSDGAQIVVCRHLEAIYGIDIALKAFVRIAGRHPSAHLWIAGKGPERDALACLAEQLGLADRVTFTGQLTPEQMLELYARADLMLNPSRIDNAPNALLEALAAGIPVVSTNAGGVPYLVEDGKTALLVPVDDSEALADAALKVLGDCAVKERLRQAGRKKARSHDWEAVKMRWIDLYHQVLPGE